MYEFRDLSRVRAPVEGDSTQLPVDAFSYNGHWLDKEIGSYMTLSVEGRENYSRTVNAQETSEDGSVYLSSRIPAKSLKVNFFWKANDVKTFNSDVRKLKEILNEPEGKVVFADEPNYHYTGTIEDIDFENSTLSTKGSITINCSNPFQFSNLKTISGKGKNFTISDNELAYRTKPTRLEFVASSNGSKIEIENSSTKKKIKANISYSAGNEIIFDFDDLDFKVEKVSHLMDLDLSSNFDDFLIKNGDKITTTIDGSYKLIYEVKQL